jgi:hypothetical protein
MTKEFVISDRFIDADGKPAKIKIQSILQEENERLLKASTHPAKDSKGFTYDKFDNSEYHKRLINRCVAEPDFSRKEFCDTYGTFDPLDVPGKMFTSGEYAKLISEIIKLNGYKEVEELTEEAKNS